MLDINEALREQVEDWISRMNEVPTDMIDKLMDDESDWDEVTTPDVGDRVYVYSVGNTGRIIDVREPSYDDGDDEILYQIRLGSGYIIFCNVEEFEVERDSRVPMWSTMWSFYENDDQYWIEDPENVRIMSKCGFRVYKSLEFGYFFGIDGAGYDFYSQHWIPLYEARMKGNV